jgi:anti-anti-sigma factor
MMGHRRGKKVRAVADGALTYEIRRERERTTVHLLGDFDLATVEKVALVLEHEHARGPRHLVVDLSRIEFLDSSGLHLLHTIGNRVAADGGGLTITNPSHAAAKAIRLTAMDQVLSITPTTPDSIVTGS